MSDILAGLLGIGILAAALDEGDGWYDVVGQRFNKACEEVINTEKANVNNVKNAVAENAADLSNFISGLDKEVAKDLDGVLSDAKKVRDHVVNDLQPRELYVQSEKLKKGK